MPLLCLEGLPAGAAPGRLPAGEGSQAVVGSQPRVSGCGVPSGVTGWVCGCAGGGTAGLAAAGGAQCPTPSCVPGSAGGRRRQSEAFSVQWAQK